MTDDDGNEIPISRGVLRAAARDPYELLTREQVAEWLHCSVQHVSTLTTGGKLVGIRIGKRVLIPRANLVAFIRNEPVGVTDGNWPPTPSLFDNERCHDTPTDTDPT